MTLYDISLWRLCVRKFVNAVVPVLYFTTRPVCQMAASIKELEHGKQSAKSEVGQCNPFGHTFQSPFAVGPLPWTVDRLMHGPLGGARQRCRQVGSHRTPPTHQAERASAPMLGRGPGRTQRTQAARRCSAGGGGQAGAADEGCRAPLHCPAPHPGRQRDVRGVWQPECRSVALWHSRPERLHAILQHSGEVEGEWL